MRGNLPLVILSPLFFILTSCLEVKKDTVEEEPDVYYDYTESSKTAEPDTTSVKPDIKKKAEPVVDENEVRITKIVNEQYPLPDIKPLEEITKDWTDVPARAYPEKVVADTMVTADLMVNGKRVGKKDFKPGEALKPVKLSKETLLVASLTNSKLRTTIPVSQTNFKEQIQKKYDDFVKNAEEKVAKQRVSAREALLKREKEERAAGASKPAHSRIPTNKTEFSDPKLSPVKASIRSGTLAYELDEVVSYYWIGKETFSGQSYETVLVNFKGQTMFGTFESQYKCLLQNGRVVKWVDPLTHERMDDY